MEELKRQKLEDVVMPDKNKILKKITKNNSFVIKVFKPFSSLAIDFLLEFSNELRKNKINNYPDLIYLSLWCSKKKIENLKKNFFLNNNLRLGRGLVFHICPSNVPTNFFYSFIFGILSGNSNILKIPNKDFVEKNKIISTVEKLFKKKKYKNIKNSNFFLNYDATNKLLTKEISSICDSRVIWGGDNTINEVRKFWIPERCVELTFSDRYSISIINSEKFKNLNKNNRNLIIKSFFYDAYTMNQQACNSPHVIFWIGRSYKKEINLFWNELNKIVKKKFILDEKIVIDKYVNLLKNSANYNEFKNLKMFKNYLYVVNLKKSLKNIENLRGINGTFYQQKLNNLSELKEYISKKCQTVTYFGFESNELKSFLLKSNLFGIDRMVPIGKGLDIGPQWDGHDILGSLSRVISLE